MHLPRCCLCLDDKQQVDAPEAAWIPRRAKPNPTRFDVHVGKGSTVVDKCVSHSHNLRSLHQAMMLCDKGFLQEELVVHSISHLLKNHRIDPNLCSRNARKGPIQWNE